MSLSSPPSPAPVAPSSPTATDGAGAVASGLKNDIITPLPADIDDADLETLCATLLKTELAYNEKVVRLLALQCRKRVVVGSPLMITPAELTTLFNNVDDLYDIHNTFAMALFEKHLDCESPAATALEFAKLMMETMPKLKAYSSYLLNYKTAVYLLRELNEFHLGVANFVKITEACYGLKFEHLLSASAHRLPQYLILFAAIYENLVVEGSLNDEQDKILSEQIDALNDMMLAIARKYRDESKSGSVLLFQNMLGGPSADLVAPGRYVIKARKLTKLDPAKPNKKPLRKLFVLCNDIFVYGQTEKKLKGGKVDFRVSLDTSSNVTVREVVDGTIAGYANALRVNCAAKSFIIVAESAEERNDWIQCIKVAVTNHNTGGMIAAPGLDAISEDVKLDEEAAARVPQLSGTIGKTTRMKRMDSFLPGVAQSPTAEAVDEANLSSLQKKIRVTLLKYAENVLTVAEPVKRHIDDGSDSEGSEEY